MAELYACTRAGMSLGYDLKKTIESVKKQDFMGTVTGLLTITQQTGALEACGVKLEKEHLVNAITALCPRNWDVIEDQLAAFEEDVYQKVMVPKRREG